MGTQLSNDYGNNVYKIRRHNNLFTLNYQLSSLMMKTKEIMATVQKSSCFNKHFTMHLLEIIIFHKYTYIIL